MKFSPYIVSAILITIFGLIGCAKHDKLDPVESDQFVGRYQMLHQLYKSNDVNAAEVAMKRLEERITEIKGNPVLSGSKEKEDFLRETSIRLWGIYHFTNRPEDMEVYAQKVRSLSKSQKERFSEQELLEMLDQIDGFLKPEWLGLPKKKWFPSGMTLEELEEAGHIKREN